MEDYLIYLYAATQSLTFFVYVPAIRTVWRSPTADAINVPAQFSFFTIGAIAALYMMVVNGDSLATLVICGHITVGNLTTALIALYKQRKVKNDLKIL